MFFKQQSYLVARRLLFMIIVTGVAFNVAGQGAASVCGDLANHYGPFDYRTSSTELRERIEDFHFTPQVEGLIRGQSTMVLGADLNYTLRVFPNHHRALLSLMRYGKRVKSSQPAGLNFPVECYFERALRFQKDDAVTRMLYATFLAENDRRNDALAELERATKTAGDNAFTQFNAGLIYLDLQEYDKALAQAHKAMALGFPRDDLRDRLTQLGKWQEAEKMRPPSMPSAPNPAPSIPQ
jgi:hypothetical protein